MEDMAKGKKYYVVWQGKIPGIYEDWNGCRQQVEGFKDAKYKSFETLEEAQRAFQSGFADYLKPKPKAMTPILEALYGSPVVPSIAVDGACSGKTGDAEYRGVDTGTGACLFHQGPFPDGTNNIMEFLAIVHALAFCAQRRLDLPIYSDSRTALLWVRHQKAATKQARTERNAVLFDLIARAEKWLQTHTYPNRLLKWETEAWGEIPADFGRK